MLLLFSQVGARSAFTRGAYRGPAGGQLRIKGIQGGRFLKKFVNLRLVAQNKRDSGAQVPDTARFGPLLNGCVDLLQSLICMACLGQNQGITRAQYGIMRAFLQRFGQNAHSQLMFLC